MQERASQRCPATRITGTRKTPWGLLDKRALHLGGGGTHRLNLADGIVIKNNHLALLRAMKSEPPAAVVKAWEKGGARGFIEVEVRSEDRRDRGRARIQAAGGRPCQRGGAGEW